MKEIVNKVKKQDKLVTIDLETFDSKKTIIDFDIKDFLFKGLILKEKEFRKQLSEYVWEKLDGKCLALHCSTDAIVAKWAYMLVTAKAKKFAQDVFYGSPEGVAKKLFKRNLDAHDWTAYQDKFVLLKGCSTSPISEEIYLHATKKLLPHVKKLMYGEACSSVPVYSKPRN